MSRKRFPISEVQRHVQQARSDDQASPPQREYSLADVVRALWSGIDARREAGHSFERIAAWLGSLGYPISGATLCVYWHRFSPVTGDAAAVAAVPPSGQPPPSRSRGVAPATEAASPPATPAAAAPPARAPIKPPPTLADNPPPTTFSSNRRLPRSEA